jgi:hypothetical protein
MTRFPDVAAALESAEEPDGGAPPAPPDPLFILSAPRSFSSVVCAMLGQHDELYDLLETGLFNVATMRQWWNAPRHAGLLRCVAQLYFGEQSEESIVKAEAWLRRRTPLPSALVFEALVARVAPRILIEKTPAMALRPAAMQRTVDLFPGGRYLHLLRHPRGYGESVMNHVLNLAAERNEPPPRWVRHIRPLDELEEWQRGRRRPPARDPQWDWLRIHHNILAFLDQVPEHRQLSVRGEELLADPDGHLEAIARWLGVRADDEAIAAMKHPELGPYSFIGPPNARLGSSRYFLQDPALRPDRGKRHSLDGPLVWREDGAWFAPAVRRLAVAFGYG